MSQQIILESIQVFCLYSLKIFLRLFSLRSFSISHGLKKNIPHMNWVTHLVSIWELSFEEKSAWHQNGSSQSLQLRACFCEFLLLKWEIQSNSTDILLTKGFLGYHTSHEFQPSLCNSKVNRRRNGWSKCIYRPATSTWLMKGQSSAGNRNKGAS